MKLDKQKILNEAPGGATYYFAPLYYRIQDGHTFFFEDEWEPSVISDIEAVGISIKDLRAMPDTLFSAAVSFESYVECLRCTPPEKRPFIMSEWQDARRTLKLDPEPAENWSEEDEKRQDVVNQNGNTGDHYQDPPKSKYHREIKKGVWVDVYDVLVAWQVTNPALAHLIKKALQPGERGHKTKAHDLRDIVESAKRAVELEGVLYGRDG